MSSRLLALHRYYQQLQTPFNHQKTRCMSPEKRKKNTMNVRHTIISGPARIPVLWAGLVGFLSLAASLPAIAQIHYKITDLGALPGLEDTYVWQQTLNNRGHVAAYANSAANPNAFAGDFSFLWKGAGKVELLPDLPGASETLAFGMNDLDQVVGMSGAAGDSVGVYAVLWEKGVAHNLGALPGDAGSQAIYINNRGVAVGGSCKTASVWSAVFWQEGKIHLLLPPKDSPTWTACNLAYSINDEGEIAGQCGPSPMLFHTVVWKQGRATDLGTLGGDCSMSFSINDRSQIVGYAQTATGDWHASLWQKGTVTDLGTFGTDTFSMALSINNRGQIVGCSNSYALLWEKRETVDLQTRIPGDSGWVLWCAASINDLGQINGIGMHNGQIRAFLLTPSECKHECH